MRSNQNSDLSSVAPDATVANDRKDLRRIRIENDILGKDEILGLDLASKRMGLGGKPGNRAASLTTRS